MYPEFIAIYIGLVILIGLGIAILILLVKLNKNSDGFPMSTAKPTPTINSSQPASNDSGNENMAFCKKCATQFNASERFCPKCGTQR